MSKFIKRFSFTKKKKKVKKENHGFDHIKINSIASFMKIFKLLSIYDKMWSSNELQVEQIRQGYSSFLEILQK